MMEIIPRWNWERNLKLSNGTVELITTLDVGPRILHFGFADGPNVFKEYPSEAGGSNEDIWMIRGGHRLWVAPEADYCYTPDNGPVGHHALGDLHFSIIWNREESYGWTKKLDVRMEETGSNVHVIHQLTAVKDMAYPIAPWSLSVMAPGGVAVIPQAPCGSHPEDLLPNRRLVFWPYTNIQDPRFSWGWPNIEIRQDPGKGPAKIGILHSAGWAGYKNNGCFFKKTVNLIQEAEYPDMGVNFELFTNEEMLELESLAPLCLMKKGQTVEHRETWTLEKF